MDHKFTLRYIDTTNILECMTDSKKRFLFREHKNEWEDGKQMAAHRVQPRR